MSGPKCTEWSVAENLRLAVLARQAALHDAKALETEVEAAQRELVAVCARTGAALSAVGCPTSRKPSSSADLEAIRGYISELHAVRDHVRDEVEQAESLARFRDAVAAACEAANDVRQEKAVAAQEAAERLQAARRDGLNRRTEGLQRLLTRLPSSTSEPDRLAAEALATEAFLAGTEGQARGLEMELRARVQNIRDRETAKAREAKQANVLLNDLSGLQDKTVERLKERLKGIVNGHGQVDNRLRADVEAARVSAMAKADREYAADVLREEFASLGYAVGEDFTTAFVQGGSILVNRPDRSTHSVALHFDPHAGKIDSEVVRRFQRSATEVDPAREDAEAEQAWCSDFSKVLSGAWRRKVQARVVRRLPAGATPVRTVESAIAKGAAVEQAGLEAPTTQSAPTKPPGRRLKARKL